MITNERNPYLKRVFSLQPHKYSYDLETGNYLLINQEGGEMPINKNGTLPAKFKNAFSGFASHKVRYLEAAKDPALLHFAPDLTFTRDNSYHTPMPDKFSGYAQYPYHIKKQFPHYLRKPNEPSIYPNRKIQSQSMCTGAIKQSKKITNFNNKSLILENSATKFIVNPNHESSFEKDTFFANSFNSMTHTKPLPKQKKRSCYNYKCKNLKYFTFDEKSKIESAVGQKGMVQHTIGIDYYKSTLAMQEKQSKLMSTMGQTACTNTNF